MVSRPFTPGTGLTMRPKFGEAQLAGEARCSSAGSRDGRPRHRGPADAQTCGSSTKRAAKYFLNGSSGSGADAGPDPGDPLAVDVSPDRLSVPAKVPGDRRDRPAPASQCMCFHVSPMCEPAERVSLRAGWLARSSASKRAHRRGWMVRLTGTGWGISVIRKGGERFANRWHWHKDPTEPGRWNYWDGRRWNGFRQEHSDGNEGAA